MPTNNAIPMGVEEQVVHAALTVQENGGAVSMSAGGGVIKAVSPTVDLDRVAGGVQITVKDVRGSQSETVFDGTKGDKGDKGDPGNFSLDQLLVTDSASGAVASFADGGDDLPMKALTIGIAPVQDLHGQDSPYPPGGGKNLLPLTVQKLKDMNTDGTWNGNAYSHRGVTFTVITDNGGNVVNVTASGTANYNAYLIVCDSMNNVLTVGNEYILTGCPANGSRSTYAIIVGTGPSSARLWIDEGSGYTLTYSDTYAQTDRICIVTVFQGTTVTNLSFAPMMRLSSASSDYAPYSNICPITGHTGVNVSRTGKNLVNEAGMATENITYENGVLTGTGNSFANKYGSTKDPLPIPNIGERFTISVEAYTDGNSSTTGNGLAFYFLYTDGTNSALVFENSTSDWVSKTLTSASGKTVRAVSISYGSKGANIWHIRKLMVEPGTTATAFEPFGNVYPITWETAAGTVYGGTLDVVNGVLTVDSESVVFDGSQDEIWSLQSINSYGIANFGIYPYNYKDIDDSKCNYLTLQKTGIASTTTEGYNFAGTNTFYVRLKSSRAGTVSDFRTWLASNPLQLVYKLATPTTVTLSAQQISSLLGQNNISGDDGGDTNVTYYADTKLYIEKRLAELQALILEN